MAWPLSARPRRHGSQRGLSPRGSARSGAGRACRSRSVHRLGGVPFSLRLPNYRADSWYETAFPQAALPVRRCSGVPGRRSSNRHPAERRAGFFSFLSTVEQAISPGLPSPWRSRAAISLPPEMELIRAAVLVEVAPEHACCRQPACQRGGLLVCAHPPHAVQQGGHEARVAEADAAARPRPPGTWDAGAGPPPQQRRLLDAPAAGHHCPQPGPGPGQSAAAPPARPSARTAPRLRHPPRSGPASQRSRESRPSITIGPC
jgi:hypothetical protein